jgi:beta-galactosidase
LAIFCIWKYADCDKYFTEETKMKIGVDYYPEHWDKSLWESDADLMKKTGVKIVRMGEFAWCRFEPEDGRFDFEWLDEIVQMFAEREIDVVLCTPTNCPPLWLCEKYPEIVPTGRDGRSNDAFIRGHRCVNNPVFLRYAERIVDVMTKHYAQNRAVVAWQIDNELEANFCFCDNCKRELRGWFKKKYGTVENLNRAHGNIVWSGEYSSWEQIKPPFGSNPHAWLNSAFMLDFNRYASDSAVKYVRMQTDIIRKNCPNAAVTTNTWFCRNMPDFYEEFSQLDFVSYDNYPTTKIPENPEECYTHSFHLDLMRGVKRQDFWIMEQLSGGLGSWSPMSRTPSPGMIEGYSLQALAHGADTVLHFRWRTAVSGAEMHWHGLIDHSNVPGRRFEEFAHLCKTVEKLGFVENTVIKAKVAILYSPENEWAFKIQPQTDGMSYFEQLKLLHGAFSKYGLNVDIVSQTASLDGYEIIAAPQMYITDKTAVRNLYDFAEKGGTVILTNRSGVKDEHNNCVTEPLPTVYRELVGAYVEEYDPIGYDGIPVKFADGESFVCRQWCDILRAESAEVIAAYDGDFFKGKPAVTANRFGRGKAYYVGTVGGKRFYYKLIRDILTERATEFTDGLPDNVELNYRSGSGHKVRFIFNNTDKAQSFAIGGESISLKPFEMKIDDFREQP